MPTPDRAIASSPGWPYRAWLAYCRPGFESECVQELSAYALAHQLAGYPQAKPGRGHAAFVLDADDAPMPSISPMPIFARQLLQCFARLENLPADDRLSPVIDTLIATGGRWRDVWIESSDDDTGRELAALCRRFGRILRNAMTKHQLLSDDSPHRLHAFFADGRTLLLAEADPRIASPWPGGIPRLRRLAGAPSRSSAKLDEAFATMLNDDERERLLKPGMTAVDLGAAPGGWSWVLARRHLRVTAIDNGSLAAHVLDSGLVDHIRADGFVWQPPRSVDWLVCDMVEQPARVAALMGQWLRPGLCRHALFNLKLPMKKRYAETLRCLEIVRHSAERPIRLRCRQLYHDREEVTVFISIQ